jgi:hypothetical protein
VLKQDAKGVPGDAAALLARARALLGEPTLTAETASTLHRFATRALGDADAGWKKRQYPPLVENALRQLLASAPDLQTC